MPASSEPWTWKVYPVFQTSRAARSRTAAAKSSAITASHPAQIRPCKLLVYDYLMAHTPSVMKPLLSRVLSTAIYIYFIGLFCCLPYFNWRYAKDHGVVEWIAFGEIIPSAQAAIWPYYMAKAFLVKRVNDHGNSYTHYHNSKQACDEALKIVIARGGLEAIPAEEKADIISLFDSALREARMVRVDYLASIHPDLPKRYVDGYIYGVETLTSGIIEGDRVKTIRGTARFNEFADWMSSKKSEIHFR